MKVKVDALLWLAPALLGAACDRAEEGRQVPMEDVAQEYARALCQVVHGCCTGERLDSRNYGRDLEICEARLHGMLEERFDVYRAAQAEERVHWQPGAAGACLDELSKLGCGNFRYDRRYLPGNWCLQMVSGRVGNTATCFFTEECAEEGTCEREWSGGKICRRHPGADEPCPSSRCKSGLACLGGRCRPASEAPMTFEPEPEPLSCPSPA